MCGLLHLSIILVGVGSSSGSDGSGACGGGVGVAGGVGVVGGDSCGRNGYSYFCWSAFPFAKNSSN